MEAQLPQLAGAFGLLCFMLALAFRLILYGDRIRREAYTAAIERAESAEGRLVTADARVATLEAERNLWQIRALQAEGSR